MQEVQITNWAFIGTGDPYQAPELKRLAGTVLNHPRHKPNTEIRSSRIVYIDMDNRVVETHNTRYILVGNPDPEFLKYLKELNHPLYKVLRPD